MDFWFEFLDVHMNEKEITCHDYFKWKNINIYPNLFVFLCGPTPFFRSLDYDYTHLDVLKRNFDLGATS
jgi:hypothetical protein